MARTTGSTTASGRRAAPAGRRKGGARAKRARAPAAKPHGRKLVIVESPAKARTINRYLGPDFVVMASMGHVRDLPAKELGVDLDHDFAPTYEPLAGRGKVLTELRRYARSAPEVYLATDLDREGEAIAWHLAEALKIGPGRLRRVVFNEITRPAIQAAFAAPGKIDANKVDAQQARRILDRLVGYQVSPLLWKKVARGLSAGRVQTVAVRLIVEREREVRAFEPEEFWKIAAVFTPQVSSAGELEVRWREFLAGEGRKGKGPTQDEQLEFLAGAGAFRGELVQWQGDRFDCGDSDRAEEVAGALGMAVEKVDRRSDPDAKGPARNLVRLIGRVDRRGAPAYVVESIKERTTNRAPPGPFTTATMQQTASVRLRFSAMRSMRVAQQLYEGIEVPGEGSVGLITYMRTDSQTLSPQAVGKAREFVAERFGGRYVPDKPRVYRSSRRAQGAHEAIRPTDVSLTPESLAGALKPDQLKLYELIWRRFVACQMSPAQWSVTEAAVAVQTPEGKGLFKAIGRRLLFDGFLKVAGMPRHEEQTIPPLDQGQPVGPVWLDPVQCFTQPPPRYTEASLVKALEAEGIGRPSTYAAIIQTIQDRQYVELLDRKFHATDLGMVVNDKLIGHFSDIFDVRFTARLEDQLDEIEADKVGWVSVLRDFYAPFKADLERATEEMVHAKAESEPSEYTCPDCGKEMAYRWSRHGRYLGCTGYPECKRTFPVDKEGKKMEQKTTDVLCPKCDSPMVIRQGRFGPFLSCSTYPDCDGIVNLDKDGGVKLPSAPPLEVELSCSKCGKPMNLRRGARGPWLSCSGFPKCRGRVGWKGLEPDRQKELESKLAAHEQANPQPVIRRLEGKAVEAGYRPGDEEHPAEADGGGDAGPPKAGPAGIDCPKCGKPMLIRDGRRGQFVACSGYPRCKHTLDLSELDGLKSGS